MYVISYKGGESGCPQNSIHGELFSYSWSSNDFADKKFPPEGVILDFYAQHKIVDTDFYFGSEFVCSAPLLGLINDSNCGEIDVREVRLHQESKSFPLASKKYYLVRSREIHKILDMDRSKYDLRLDLVNNAPEEDAYHSRAETFEDGKKTWQTKMIN